MGTARRAERRGAVDPGVVPELCVGIVASDPSELRRVAEGLGGPEFDVAAVSFDVKELIVEARGLELDAVVSHCGESLETMTASMLRRLRKLWPGVAFVAVCQAVSLRDLRRALAVGLNALVLDDELDAALGPAVRAACAGQLSVPNAARPHVYGPALSLAEREVLSGVAAGLTNSEIASRLHISTSTVKSRLAQAFGKLGVASRKEAADALRSVEGGPGTGR